MMNPRFEGLLNRLGINFYWYEQNRFWWVRKTRPDGKVLRSNPAGAENREEAETAAIKFINRQFREKI